MQWLQSFWTPKRWLIGSIRLPIQRWDSEYYLPFRPNELIERLCALEPERGIDRNCLEPISEQLKRSIHLQYQSHHEYLTDLYAKFDPDRDLDDREYEFPEESYSSESAVDEVACRNLFAEIADSLHHANYRRLTPREILAAIGAASYWGVRLRIRFSSFRRLEVYARGDIVTRRTRHDWRKLFRRVEVDVPVYQRLVVIFRPKELQSFADPLDPTRVHLRMFKNIPKEDIDMMLPGSQIKLTWLDTGKIGIPTLWGIFIMTSKIAKTLGFIALLSTLKILSSFVLIAAAVLATLFYSVKSVFSYTTTKRRYQLSITKSLYYQNLDNNFGALLRLEEEAEQQEICESLLGYYILVRENRTLSREEIDRMAETILLKITGFPINFDVEDALRDLVGLGIVQFTDPGWSLISPPPSP